MKKKRTVKKRKVKIPFWVRGDTTLYILLAVVIIGAFFLVGGLSNGALSPGGQPQQLEPITTDRDSSKDSLQLQTLRFKRCSTQMNVDLLLDRSGSMRERTTSNQTKLNRLKEGVLALTKNLSDDSVIGIQTFSSDQDGTLLLDDAVPIGLYKNSKTIIPTKVNALTSYGNTPTAGALNFSLEKLKEGINKFPDRKINFIFLTDGQPVPDSQDPRLPENAPNPATEIKNLGVDVYTIGIYSASSPRNPNNDKLSGLLKSIASKPENYFEASTGDEITTLLSQITQRICNTDPTPTP